MINSVSGENYPEFTGSQWPEKSPFTAENPAESLTVAIPAGSHRPGIPGSGEEIDP
ncbi:hypothetical protein GCM10009414_27200 [Tatumella terrea]